MDDEARQAVHRSVGGQAPSVREVHDVYKREADAWLEPGISRREATQRVIRQMSLKQAESHSESVAVFTIEHSTLHSQLHVHFEDGAYVRYELHATNGEPTD